MNKDTIYKEDAIDAIECVTWYHQNRNKDMVSGANSAEHQAWYKAEDIYDALEAVPSADRPQEWILCSERLPESDYMCLVSCKTKKGVKSVNRAYYSDGYWHGSGSMSGVEAWMPLPKPWKGADDDMY